MAENFALYLLISTAITRIGAVLLLIFGAQVLINFYRYNLRLAAFYDSRADALELLADGNIKRLALLVSAFSADQIELGGAPKTPTQEVVDAAGAIASVSSKKA